MADMAILNWLGGLPRWLSGLPPTLQVSWGAYLIAGIALGIVTYRLAPKTGEASAEKPPFQQQNVTNNVPFAATNGQAPEKVISAPVQIDKLSQTAGGDIENSIGKTVNERRTSSGNIIIIGNNNTFVNGGLIVDERDYELEDPAGGKAKLLVYLLYRSAAWSYGSSSSLINHGDKRVSLTDFLDSHEFAQHLENFDAIVCLGLASGVSKGSVTRTMALSDERAVHLCGLVSHKVAVTNKKAKTFGLPLGYHKNSNIEKNTIAEREQRSVVILGISSASGTLKSDVTQQRIISEILKEGIIEDFKPSEYSEVASGEPLCFIEIKRGHHIYSKQCSGFKRRIGWGIFSRQKKGRGEERRGE